MEHKPIPAPIPPPAPAPKKRRALSVPTVLSLTKLNSSSSNRANSKDNSKNSIQEPPRIPDSTMAPDPRRASDTPTITPSYQYQVVSFQHLPPLESSTSKSSKSSKSSSKLKLPSAAKESAGTGDTTRTVAKAASATRTKSRLSSKEAMQLRSNMLPYRENGVLKYLAMPPSTPSASASTTTTTTPPPRALSPPRRPRTSTSTHSTSTTSLHSFHPNAYDSDLEPLIVTSRAAAAPPLDDDAVLRFTATGRPMPAYRPSSLANLGGNLYMAAQHLPQRYTDESVIPVIVRLAVGGEGAGERREATSRRKSLLGKLKGENHGGHPPVKVVYMPRGEYLKYFARDHNAQYIGSEPEQEWTEADLVDKYGKYTKFSLSGK